MSLHKYRYTGDAPQVIPSHNIEVEPGQEIEVEESINHPDFQPVKEKPKKKGVDE